MSNIIIPVAPEYIISDCPSLTLRHEERVYFQYNTSLLHDFIYKETLIFFKTVRVEGLYQPIEPFKLFMVL